jgi:uncharacterized protein
VAIVADSGAIYALYDRRDRHHRAMTETLALETGAILIPAAILAEIDYLLRARIGAPAEQRFLEGIEKGAFTVEPFTLEDASFCRKLLARYQELDLGLADASVAAVAERRGILRLLTVDKRHFRAIRTTTGKRFTLLPADL